MGQITHPTLGSPMAMVTSNAELVVTGSVMVTNSVSADTGLYAGSDVWVQNIVNTQIVSGLHGPLGANKASLSLTTINHEHNIIHNGNHYHVRGDTTIASSGGSVCFYMFTENGSRWTHLIFDVYSDNLIDYKEQIECIASGANLIPVYNSNRNSTNVYVGSLIMTPLIVTSSGITSATGFLGAAGTNPNQKGVLGDYGRDNEVILKSGTGYIWTFKAGANNTRLGWDAEWYVHTDKIKQW